MNRLCIDLVAGCEFYIRLSAAKGEGFLLLIIEVSLVRIFIPVEKNAHQDATRIIIIADCYGAISDL